MVAPSFAIGVGGSNCGASYDCRSCTIGEFDLVASSTAPMPDSVPLAVPSPFWQQAEKKPGSSSPKAGTELRDRHSLPPQLCVIATSSSIGKPAAERTFMIPSEAGDTTL